jgi:sulfite exporter TauE/SafE
MNSVSWVGVAFASLVGSAHCATMCGPFVAAYASGEREPKARRALSHLTYNLGRLLTYLALGAAAGTLGRALDLAGHAAGLANVAGIVTGVLLLFWGALGLWPRPALIQLRKSNRRFAFTAWVSSLFASFAQKPALVRAGLLGLSTTLLPCGWLYAFVAFAATTRGAAQGAWLMSAFWLGSLPMMLGVGWSLQGVARRLQSRLPRLRSALVLAVGVVTLLLRFQMPALAATGHAASTTAGSALPRSADCPCHAKRRAWFEAK